MPTNGEISRAMIDQHPEVVEEERMAWDAMMHDRVPTQPFSQKPEVQARWERAVEAYRAAWKQVERKLQEQEVNE